jgi:tetratricopeptide (TPR) repeat protein
LSIPFERYPLFIGREDSLGNLRNTLLQQGRQAITGVAGVGKTQLAVEYAYRHWSAGDYSFIFWANAQTTEDLLVSWGKLAGRLGLAPNDNVELLIDSVTYQLQTITTPWLIVLDGVQNPAALRRFLPTSTKGHTILTSLDRELDSLGIFNALHLHELSESDAVTFLLRRTGKANSGSSEIDAATTLADKELGALPLALEQAAAYISKTHCSFAEYLESYETRQLELLERGTPTNYPSSLVAALTQNLNQLSVKGLELARILAFLDEVSTPRHFLITAAKALGGTTSELLKAEANNHLAIDELLQPLFDYALIQRDEPSGDYRMHNMVQVAIRELAPHPLRRTLEEVSVRTYNLEVAPADLLAYESPGPEFIYGKSAAELIFEGELNSRDAGELLQKLGMHAVTLGNFEFALIAFERSREILVPLVGLEDPAMTPTLLGLALLSPPAERELAEKYYLQVIDITKNENLIQLRLVAQNNLGEIYRNRKRYSEAKALLESSLAERIHLLGRNHTAVSTTLNNLGNWYADQHNYKIALSFYQEAADIRAERLPKPNTLWANSLNNLGYVYLKLNWLKAAEKVLKESLQIYESLYGPETSLVIHPLINLAELNRKRRRNRLAKELYDRARQIQAKIDQRLPFLPPVFGTRSDK